VSDIWARLSEAGQGGGGGALPSFGGKIQAKGTRPKAQG
jgi:hypothetical protein